MVHPCPEECNEKLDKGGVVHLCEVEQDLVMKVDGKGEALKNASALVYDILFPKSKGEASPENTYSNFDKFRVLALYILYNNGEPLLGLSYVTPTLHTSADLYLLHQVCQMRTSENSPSMPACQRS